MKRKAKVILTFYDHQNKLHYLLGKRTSGGETFWWLPGGSAEENESLQQGAIRELQEELIFPATLLAEIQSKLERMTEPNFSYSNEKNSHYFFCILLSINSVVIPDIKEEFDEVKWFTFENFPSNMSREFFKVKEYMSPEKIISYLQ